jgi:hypothetical protein
MAGPTWRSSAGSSDLHEGKASSRGGMAEIQTVPFIETELTEIVPVRCIRDCRETAGVS